MKYKKWVSPAAAFILIVSAIWVVFVFDDYNDEISVNCQVLDKVQTNGQYAMLYLVVKDERGQVFDISVSPATFSQCKVGYIYAFSLRKGIIGVNEMPRWVIALFIVLGVIAILWFLFTWPSDEEPKSRGGGGMSTSQFVLLSGGGLLR